MIIAVNTKFLSNDRREGIGYFAETVFNILARQYPQHQFYFLSDQPIHNAFNFPENVHPLVVSPLARSPLRWRYWYDLKVPLTLRKLKADAFVSLDGICSLTTKVPQCLLVPDLGFLTHPEAYQKSHYQFYKKHTPGFLKKANALIAVSQAEKIDIINEYHVDSQKLTVVGPAARQGYHPVSFEQQAVVKEKYAQGREYFIGVDVAGSKNLLNLLKAFSFFKKRQRSGMKLLLVTRGEGKMQEFLQLLKTYKYREDVVVINEAEEEEVIQLLASAYALVHLSSLGILGTSLLDAMTCGVPVLSSNKAWEQELGEDAAVYFRADDHADIADKLMLIYKDEDLRKSIIEKGRMVAGKYSWQQAAGLIWEAILKAVGGVTS
jgi:glycosyltransferase involved in cell wall biosynthesis